MCRLRSCLPVFYPFSVLRIGGFIWMWNVALTSYSNIIYSVQYNESFNLCIKTTNVWKRKYCWTRKILNLPQNNICAFSFVYSIFAHLFFFFFYSLYIYIIADKNTGYPPNPTRNTACHVASSLLTEHLSGTRSRW